MSDLVTIHHAAPVVHVPPRSRAPRTTYVAMATRAALPELSRSEVSEGPRLPVNGERELETLVVRGALWRPVGTDAAFSQRARKAPRGDGFKAWLAGDPDFRAHDEDDVGRALEGTPVLARAPDQRTAERGYEPVDPSRIGRILHETREILPAAVRGFVEDSLLLVDGHPFARMHGPVCYYDKNMGHTRIYRNPGAWTTNGPANQAMPFRCDRLEDLARFEGRGSVERAQPNWDPEALSGFFSDRNEDVDLFLRDALRIYRGYLGNIVNAPAPFDPTRVDPLLRLSALASVGILPPEEGAATCELVAALSADAVANLDRGFVADHGRSASRYVREHALPLVLAAAPAPDEDIDSLASLQP